MYSGAFDRTISLIGETRFSALKTARVLVVGLGGVGGAAVEVLARSGVGGLTLVDGDVFEPTNFNRQILCCSDTLGKNKAEVAVDRVRSIAEETEVIAIPEFLSAENSDRILSRKFDYCIDAIDDMRNKVLLIKACTERCINIVSAMGACNRIDCDFIVTDVYKTKDDPFARKLRGELRKVGVERLDVVCATDPPCVKSGTPYSFAAPPLVMGAVLANYAVRRIADI